METIYTKFAALQSSAKYVSVDDQEAISKIADAIGLMDRDAYLAFLALWKSTYKTLSAEIRILRTQRKGGTPEAAKAITSAIEKSSDARALMALRHALKEAARRHVRAKTAEAV
jgi:hypothetical protein